MKKYLLLLLLFFISIPKLMAQKQGSIAKDFNGVVSGLQDYMAARPQEKIHIHFDKSFYNVGDTVWFKLYLVNALGNRLSSISRIAHIDIKPPSGKAKHMVLPVNMGMASAQLVLTDSVYQAGSYALRAYTQWMRNAGEDYFFNHTLKVGNMLAEKAATSARKAPRLDFFPEGGSMVAGIRSKIGFKALGEDGLSIPVKGYIENQKGEQVAFFESGYTGMGAFALLAHAVERYTAVVTDGPSKNTRFELPKVTAEGFVLSVNSAGEDNFMVRISRSAAMANHTELRLMVQANGEVKKAFKLPINEASISFTIPKAQLEGGINQITLFSIDNLPLAERLVFVQKKQSTASLLTDKAVYEARKQVKMNFRVASEKDEGIIGGYSVSVVKQDRATLPEEQQLSIYANLLLNSDLRGKIEYPNYYFTDINPQKEAELDALLLTQGWRRFSWTTLLDGKAVAPLYKTEHDQGISGQVTTMSGKPVSGAKISLLVSKQMILLDTIADQQGRFSFSDLELGEDAEVILRARGAKEGSNVKIVLNNADKQIPEFKEQWPVLLVQDSTSKRSSSQADNKAEELERQGRMQGTTLKTVEIIKRRPPEIKKSVYPAVAPPPDYTFEPDKLQEMVTLENHLRGLNGVSVRGNEIFGRGRYYDRINDREGINYVDSPMTILLNGSKISDLAGINPKSLTGVQIVKGGMIAANMALALMLPQGETNYGIVFLTMGLVDSKFIKPNRPPGLLQFPLAGYTYAREFYAPSYEQQRENPKYDYRSTLFWKPDIITDVNGKAEFSFYTSDEAGRYQVTLEGVGANGQLSRKVGYFVVK